MQVVANQQPYSNFSWEYPNDGTAYANNLTSVPIGFSGPNFTVQENPLWGLQRSFQDLFSGTLLLNDFGLGGEAVSSSTDSIATTPIPVSICTLLEPHDFVQLDTMFNNLDTSIANQEIRLSFLLPSISFSNRQKIAFVVNRPPKSRAQLTRTTPS